MLNDYRKGRFSVLLIGYGLLMGICLALIKIALGIPDTLLVLILTGFFIGGSVPFVIILFKNWLKK